MGKSSEKIYHGDGLVSDTNPFPVVVTPPSTAQTSAATSTVSFSRTADTNAYTALDVIGINAAGSPGSAIHTFATIGPSAGSVLITGVDLTIGLSSVTSGISTFRLHIYNSSPTAILDNAAFDLVSGDITKHLGYVDIPTPADFGSIIYAEALNVNLLVKLAASSTSLYGELVTVGAFTPASGTTYQIRVRAIAV